MVSDLLLTWISITPSSAVHQTAELAGRSGSVHQQEPKVQAVPNLLLIAGRALP